MKVRIYFRLSNLIYTAYDASISGKLPRLGLASTSYIDVWENPELFLLDEHRRAA